MTVSIFNFALHLPEARSLKDKRQVFRRFKDRLRSRYNVAVLEDEAHADLWQRGSVTVVSVATHRDVLERLFETILREAENGGPVQVVDATREFLTPGPGATREDDR